MFNIVESLRFSLCNVFFLRLFNLTDYGFHNPIITDRMYKSASFFSQCLEEKSLTL